MPEQSGLIYVQSKVSAALSLSSLAHEQNPIHTSDSQNQYRSHGPAVHLWVFSVLLVIYSSLLARTWDDIFCSGSMGNEIYKMYVCIDVWCGVVVVCLCVCVCVFACACPCV